MKKLLAIVLVAALLLNLPQNVLAAEGELTDIPTGWSKDAVTAAIENGLLRGDDRNRVDPQGLLTRVQLAAILVRAFGFEGKSANLSVYSDVNVGAWYVSELSAAVAAGLFRGDGSTMRPNAPITRQEVAVVLARAFYLKGDGSKLSGIDAADVSSWATNAVAALKDAGYMQGYEDTSLKPQNNITREEFAQLMYRIVKLYISNPGEYAGLNVDEFAVVRAQGVTITNSTIKQLIITQPGEYKVEVNGSVILGANGITLVNSKVTGDIIVDSALVRDTVVRISGTSVGEITSDGTDIIDPNTPTAPSPGTGGGSTGGGGGGGTTIPAMVGISVTASAIVELNSVTGSFGNDSFYAALGSLADGEVEAPLSGMMGNLLMQVAVTDDIGGKVTASIAAARNQAARIGEIVTGGGNVSLTFDDAPFHATANVTATGSGNSYSLTINNMRIWMDATAANITVPATRNLYDSVYTAISPALIHTNAVNSIRTWWNTLPGAADRLSYISGSSNVALGNVTALASAVRNTSFTISQAGLTLTVAVR
ncbi:hypothetical protein FACS1894127_4810 [Clostridia bacterium]|nr:hypothetical protein FACS1894127_4810 [Clostridia bacterium]